MRGRKTGKNYFFSEREYGVFQRVFRIPPDARPEAVEADFRNGVLSIRIPKARTDAGPLRNIEIRSNENS
ncbi:Hsp20/alpha crystallin family protein [Hyphomicrobium denitrificans]|uniref:Hsp20/alpha crystallin family protein n=1 Tax=Hyphomicrobium denitrificans TaxID=53399 RepID=UPI0009D9D7C4